MCVSPICIYSPKSLRDTWIDLDKGCGIDWTQNGKVVRKAAAWELLGASATVQPKKIAEDCGTIDYSHDRICAKVAGTYCFSIRLAPTGFQSPKFPHFKV